MYAPLNALAAALWLYLPALAANAAPVLIAKMPFFPKIRLPIWQAGLGANKTWAGLIGGVVVGVLVGYLQIAVTPWSNAVNAPAWILWSFLIALGALVGDAVKSFFKRKMGIPPGGAFPVIDGIDYVVGAYLFGLPILSPVWPIVVALLIAGPILSLIANVFSFMMGWKKVWY